MIHVDDALPIIMLPKLSALQWSLFAGLLVFYGFAVFAVTRDYYLRHPAAVRSTMPADIRALSGGQSPTMALGSQMRQALDSDAGGVDLTSSDPVSLGEAADRLFVQKRFAAAIPVYERILVLTPSDAETHNDLGLALHYSGRTREGIEVLQIATGLAPSFQRAWLSLGFVAVQSGNLDVGRPALERAQALDPGSEVGKEAARLLQVTDSSPGDQ